MKKFQILLFLFFCMLPVQTIKAQENFAEVPVSDKKAIFRETFANDSREWKDNGQDIPGKIESGQLHLDLKGRGTGKSIILHTFQAGMAANFELEARIRMVGGSCSFVCNAKNNSDLVTLAITDNNRLIASRKLPGSSKSGVIFTSPPNLFNSKEVNRLVWRKTGNRSLFFINDMLLGNIALTMPVIDQFGLECTPESDCWIEDISFSELTGTPPDITWVTPYEKSVVSYTSQLSVALCLKSGSKIYKPQVVMNGMPVTDLKGYTEKESDSCSMILKCTLELKPGKNNFNVLASNYAGSSMSSDLQVTYLRADSPMITWTMPSSLHSEISQNSVKVSAIVRSAGKLKSAAISVNGKISEEKFSPVAGKADEYLVENTIQLKPGVNYINMLAKTGTHSTLSPDLQITYSPVSPPVISWESPSEQAISITSGTARIQLKILSKTELRDVKLIVNNEESPAGAEVRPMNREKGEYIFEKSIQLKQGQNNIRLSAGNLAGDASSEAHTIVWESTAPPAITWISPGSKRSTVHSGSHTLKFEIRTDGELSQLAFGMNGAQESIDPSRLKKSENGSYQVEKPLQLKAGENKISITATNSKGIAVTDSVSIQFSRLAPPLITWVSPAKVSAESPLDKADVKVIIASSVELQDANIYLNGAAVDDMGIVPERAGKDSYSVSRSLSLKQGENVIYVVATNAGGSTRSESRTIMNRTSVPPEISWMNPQSNITVTTESLGIEVCINSPSEIKSA